MIIMPLSFGIPLGILVVVVGAILFLATKHKKTAIIAMSAGVVVTVLTFILIMLVVSSQM
jgi:hypothetical protein